VGDPWIWLLVGSVFFVFVLPFGLYLSARLVSWAILVSKDQYRRMKLDKAKRNRPQEEPPCHHQNLP
jgi:hypothetical protein